MKKRLGIVLSCIALALTLVFTLCACSTYGGVKAKFVAKGWKEDKELIAKQEEVIKMALGDDYKSSCVVHVLQEKDNDKNFVVILEFKTTEKMEEKIKESATLKGMIKDAQNSDYVSGTCVLLSHNPLYDGAAIFKSTK